MRVHEINCPKCRAGLKSKAGVPVGQSLSCPKCKNQFIVEEPEEADILDDTQVIEVEDERPPRKKGLPAPPRKKAASREDKPTEEIQLPKTKKSVKAQRDDEEDRKPNKKKKKKRQEDDGEENLFLRLKHNIFVRIITMVILLGILAVAAYLLYEKRKAEAQDANLGPVQLAFVSDLDHQARFG